MYHYAHSSATVPPNPPHKCTQSSAVPPRTTSCSVLPLYSPPRTPTPINPPASFTLLVPHNPTNTHLPLYMSPSPHLSSPFHRPQPSPLQRTAAHTHTPNLMMSPPIIAFLFQLYGGGNTCQRVFAVACLGCTQYQLHSGPFILLFLAP